jgi:hypothetical protein
MNIVRLIVFRQDEIHGAEAGNDRTPERLAVHVQRHGEMAPISNPEASSGLSNPSPSSVRSPTANTTLPSKKGTPYRQKTSLPNYSSDLPFIDRTKWGRAFYEDLRAKRIIENFDDKRWTCWCHAAKRDKIPTPRFLSVSHQWSQAKEGSQRYMSASWFAHAASCDFCKVSVSLERSIPVAHSDTESLGNDNSKWSGRAVVSAFPATEAIRRTK